MESEVWQWQLAMSEHLFYYYFVPSVIFHEVSVTCMRHQRYTKSGSWSPRGWSGGSDLLTEFNRGIFCLHSVHQATSSKQETVESSKDYLLQALDISSVHTYWCVFNGFFLNLISVSQKLTGVVHKILSRNL